MPYTLDYFVAALACPACGEVSPADFSTNMQTKVRKERNLESLGVGHPLHIDLEEVRANEYTSYETAKIPQPGEPIHILETWCCPSCSADNWAEIIVEQEKIVSIESVEFDRHHFERSHLVSLEAVEVAAKISARTYKEVLKAGILNVLREKL